MLVGLGEKAHSLPQELSGGEQQRIALARALVHSPPIIIADEPTGNIDPELSVEIMELLQAINTVGTTVVVVTHERDLAMRFNKRIITIDHGEVVGDTPPPQRRRPSMAGAGAARRPSGAVQAPAAPVVRPSASAEAGAQQSAPSRPPRGGQTPQARSAGAAAASQRRPAAPQVHAAAHPVRTGEGVDDLVQDILKKKQEAKSQPSGQKGGGQA